MNTNRISNKNTKRFAIAAGATAAVLFLSAGFVASRGGESNKNSKADAPLAVVPAPIVEEVSDLVDQIVAEAPVAEEATPLSAFTSAKSTKLTTSTKQSKVTKAKKAVTAPASTSDATSVSPEASAPSATTAAPAPAAAEASVVVVPTEQPAVEQPAAAAPAEQPAAAQSAPASQSGTTSISVPKLTMTDSVLSSLRNVDLTGSPVATNLPRLCIPGITC